jgi:hypothetical protein
MDLLTEWESFRSSYETSDDLDVVLKEAFIEFFKKKIELLNSADTIFNYAYDGKYGFLVRKNYKTGKIESIYIGVMLPKIIFDINIETLWS